MSCRGFHAEAAAIRAAQPEWAQRPIGERLGVIARLRRHLAAECETLAALVSRPNMSVADILVAEVMPLLAACRFLEKQAARVLQPRRPVGRRPPWLFGTSLLVRRVPFGVVLILGPGNYPLLLPAIQVVQALTAGNGVMVKPAPGWAAPMRTLAEALGRSGLPGGLLVVLPDTDAAGAQALEADADKVVLTGHAETGRRVLAKLAGSLTPATMELSGDDAMIVLPGAPVDIVARAIGYGLTLNGGQTCIAPRRIFAVGDVGPALVDRLDAVLRTLPPRTVGLDCAALAAAALGSGHGRVLGDTAGLGGAMMSPLVLLAADPGVGVGPVFGPVGMLVSVPDAETAVALANSSKYALGASVFGPARAVGAVARGLRAGCVVVNDVIVPTADPRLPFGGAGDSGFGVTRGAEGLLEMTRAQAVASRRWPMGVHYRGLPDSAGRWIGRALRAFYG